MTNLTARDLTVSDKADVLEYLREPIIGVAVKQGDLVICLPKPNRHHDCIRYAVDVLGLTPPISSRTESQGFYTASGRFASRGMALDIARYHKQLINKEAHHGLFSEDVW